MGYCITTMDISAKNEPDYEIVKKWCDLFSKTEKIEVYDPDEMPEHFTICYTDLNIDLDEAKKIFRDFAEFCVSQNVTDQVQMHFNVSFSNSGEEYQGLYILKDGEATEQTAYFDLSELDDEYIANFDLSKFADEYYEDFEDEEDDDYSDGDIQEAIIDEWYSNPQYDKPKKILLNADKIKIASDESPAELERKLAILRTRLSFSDEDAKALEDKFSEEKLKIYAEDDEARGIPAGYKEASLVFDEADAYEHELEELGVLPDSKEAYASMRFMAKQNDKRAMMLLKLLNKVNGTNY